MPTIAKILSVEQVSPTEYAYSIDAFEGITRFLLAKLTFTMQNSFPSDDDVQVMVKESAMTYINEVLTGHNLTEENIQFYSPFIPIVNVLELAQALEDRPTGAQLPGFVSEHFPPVVTSGSYTDLDNKPAILETLTVQAHIAPAATDATENNVVANYNALAAKFNTLLAHLEAQGLQQES